MGPISSLAFLKDYINDQLVDSSKSKSSSSAQAAQNHHSQIVKRIEQGSLEPATDVDSETLDVILKVLKSVKSLRQSAYDQILSSFTCKKSKKKRLEERIT